MKIAVIIPAAGKGERFGSSGVSKSKLEADVGGRAVFIRAIELFCKRTDVCQVIIAVAPDTLSQFKVKWGDKLGFLNTTIVPGSKTSRYDTVAKALQAVDSIATHIAVHDAARPITAKKMIDRVFGAAEKLQAVIPAVPVTATLKHAVLDDHAIPDEKDPLDAILGSAGKETINAYRVEQTQNRDNMWLVQTPQIFERDLLCRAYEQLTGSDFDFDSNTITDDAALVESLGQPVHIVAGDKLNIKITHPDDLALVNAIMSMHKNRATGNELGSKRKFPTWAQSDD